MTKPLVLMLAIAVILSLTAISAFHSHRLFGEEDLQVLLMMSKSEPSVFRIRPSIVLFGDSITQEGFGVDGNVGWASLLASAYSRRADVLNRGFSGYNTKLAVDLLPRVFTGPIATAPVFSDSLSNSSSRALFCTVFFGANDAALLGGKQHVPLESFRQNLVRIVEHIRLTFGAKTPIILLTPPPFDAQAWMKSREISTPGRYVFPSRRMGSYTCL